jgi:dolichyl-phosphate-mannose--protein O-mannosyl transferase
MADKLKTTPNSPSRAAAGSARLWGTLFAMGAVQWGGIPFALGWSSDTKLVGLLIGGILTGAAYYKLWDVPNYIIILLFVHWVVHS